MDFSISCYIWCLRGSPDGALGCPMGGGALRSLSDIPDLNMWSKGGGVCPCIIGLKPS